MTDTELLSALHCEVTELRRGYRRTRLTSRILAGLLTVALIVDVSAHARPAIAANSASAQLADSVLRVRGLIVTDARGVERVIIGAPLPDPMFLGKRGQRQGPISGILMMDAMGTERNGYGTSDESDEMIFTMDNIAGQAALFIANPNTGVHLSTWDQKGNYARIGVYDKPMLYLEREGKRTFTAPDSLEVKP